jgi:hypothetical protein
MTPRRTQDCRAAEYPFALGEDQMKGIITAVIMHTRIPPHRHLRFSPLKAIILPVSLSIMLFSSAANAEVLTVDQAEVDLTAERLDYGGTIDDFFDTGFGEDFVALVGLLNSGNGEAALVAA